MSNPNSSSIDASEDVVVRGVYKRYEGLVTVRTKAIKGKGAWYWTHLEPVLVRNPETNLPKAVKLKCILCETSFSASNPSRTASEHLKRGTCPNFSLTVDPISQIPPPCSQKNHRKRTQEAASTSTSVFAVNMVDSSRFSNEISFTTPQIAQAPVLSPKPQVLSGGKEDLGPLALLEDSVKKLKSPKASPIPNLSKEQVDIAFNFLIDWFHESCGSVSFSCLEHPKFKAFLHHVGLPQVSKTEYLSARLDSKFEEARMELEARIRDAAFFQISSDGWKRRISGNGDKCLVKFMVNLPNGTRVFQKAVYYDGGVLPSSYVEEVLWETVRAICGNNAPKCVGIIADKYKRKSLRNLELQNHWMVNLPCLLQGFFRLVKDFYTEFPIFRNVTENCSKIANLVNSKPQIRNSLHKLIRAPPSKCDISKNLSSFIAMLEDILSCSRHLHVVVLDDSYKVACLEDHTAKEVSDLIQDPGFWNDVAAAHSLVKLIMGMAEEIETERPLVGQCLPLWEELKAKLKNWCTQYNFPEEQVEKIVEGRFHKIYHPAWSTAFILDPLYLLRDPSGKYLPPFKYLTQEQEKNVDMLVTRLVPREEAHIALMELMKWRSEGLDPLYAQAVQVKQRDPLTGKMKIANPQSSRLVWETCLQEFRSLGKVAVRLLFLHATSCGLKCDSSFMRIFNGQGQSREGLERAHKLAFIAAHAKLERRDFSSVFMSGEDDMLNEVLLDTSSI